MIINLKNIIEYNLSSGQKLKEEEEEGDLHQDQVGDEVDHTYQWGLTTASRTCTNDVIVQATSTFVPRHKPQSIRIVQSIFMSLKHFFFTDWTFFFFLILLIILCWLNSSLTICFNWLAMRFLCYKKNYNINLMFNLQNKIQFYCLK